MNAFYHPTHIAIARPVAGLFVELCAGSNSGGFANRPAKNRAFVLVKRPQPMGAWAGAGIPVRRGGPARAPTQADSIYSQGLN
jgi:hypothetical protein